MVEGPPLLCVATYRRTIAASERRVWENVHDWEHLPWLHGSTFSRIARIDSGRWGWRAHIGLQPAADGAQILLELRLAEGGRRYCSKTLEGPGAGTEIWTTVTPVDDAHTGIEVEFHVPGVAAGQAEAVGAAYCRLYERLWDEDEDMMVLRAERLSRPRRREAPEPTRIALGPLEEVRARTPFCIELAGRPYRVIELDGELLGHSAVCPHLLGPLDRACVEPDGTVQCPWHGYRFDPRSGRSADGRGLRLAPAPKVEVDPATRRVTLSLG